MNWLSLLDEKYEELKSKGHLDKEYFYYPEVNIDRKDTTIQFLFLKQRKTKILLQDRYERKLYLTDADIISMLVKLDDELFNNIILSFKNYYKKEKLSKLCLQIEGKQVLIDSLYFEKEFIEETPKIFIDTKADFQINLYDLIVLVNIVLDKEKQFQEISKKVLLRKIGKSKESGKGDTKNESLLENWDQDFRVKKQLAKFISLSGYYKRNEFRTFLSEIKYDLTKESIYDVYRKSSLQLSIDKSFSELGIFENYI